MKIVKQKSVSHNLHDNEIRILSCKEKKTEPVPIAVVGNSSSDSAYNNLTFDAQKR